MRRWAWIVLCLIACGPDARAADDRDPLARARLLYNQRQFEAAIAAADQVRLNPARADSADLIAARAYLEQFRESEADDDLANARERLRRIHPGRFGPHERVEFIVGLGETLYFDSSYGAAASVFESVIAPASALTPDERERVLDWWASALDRDARPRSEFERQPIYQRIRDRMTAELAASPNSFDTADSGETSADVGYEIILSATDSDGMTGSASVFLVPHTVTLTFATLPPGLSMTRR